MANTFWVYMPIIRNIVMSAAKNPDDLREICSAGGFTVDDLENPEIKITLEQDTAVIEAAIKISGDPFLGLHTGEKTTQVVLGVTGYLMESSKDILSAFRNLQQYTGTFTKLYNYRIETSENEASFYCEPIELWNAHSPDTARHSVDLSFSGALHIIKLLTGKVLHPRKALYRYSEIPDTSEHERILGCKPLYNQKKNCMVFSLSDMSLPVIGYNKELNKIFNRLLEAELRKEQENFSQRVRHIILQSYHFEFPQLEEVADSMNITPRTLQRKLRDENSTFRSLTDSIKKELACNLLYNKGLSISEISYKLGYAEPAAFQRAFRQWTGKSPGAFRTSSR